MDVPQIKIAVSVMRAGLTVIGFNIAVVSFQLERLQTLPGGFNVSGLKYSIHVGSHVSLLLAIPVSMVASLATYFPADMTRSASADHAQSWLQIYLCLDVNNTDGVTFAQWAIELVQPLRC